MVGFQQYFEAIVAQKPEWRNAYLDYPTLAAFLNRIRIRSTSEDITSPPNDECPEELRDVHQRDQALRCTTDAGKTERASSFDNLESWRKPPPQTAIESISTQPQSPQSPAVAYPQTEMEFETLLKSEIGKARCFLQSSATTLAQYFNDLASQRAVTAEDSDARSESSPKLKVLFAGLKHVSPLLKFSEKRRMQDNLRYLYTELQHLSHFAETNYLAVKTLLHGYHLTYEFRADMDEAALLYLIIEPEEEVNRLRLAVEVYWADRYCGGSVSAAKDFLHPQAATAAQSFKAGFFSALVIATFLYWLHVWFELVPDSESREHFNRAFPIMRLFLTLFFAFVCWSGVLYVFHQCRINYLYVFEFSQLVSLTWMKCFEYGITMLFLGCLACCLYVRSELQVAESYEGTINGFRRASPWIFPSLMAVFVVSIAVPPRAVFRRTRNSFFGVLWNCCKLPWGTVRFVDFFVADWGTSLPIVLGDSLYLLCYYTVLHKESLEDNDPDNLTCDTARARWWFVFAAVPFYWRACQTIKMYRRTGKRAHLVNHCKYLSKLATFATQMWAAWSPSAAHSDLVWFMRTVSSLYTLVWDVLMDWGWIRGRRRGRMFKRLWPYAAAVLLDFLGRFSFIPVTIYLLPAIGEQRTMFLQAVVEVLRRAMWSIFRIENENLNNLEKYRSIDFVPSVVIPDDCS